MTFIPYVAQVVPYIIHGGALYLHHPMRKGNRQALALTYSQKAAGARATAYLRLLQASTPSLGP